MCDCCPCDPCCCPPQTPQKQSTFERLPVVASPRANYVITSSGEVVILPPGLQPRSGGTVLIERAAPISPSSTGRIVGALGVTPSRPQSKYLPPDEVFPVSNPSASGAWPFCQDLDLYRRVAISRSGKRWNTVFALDHTLRVAYTPPQISSGFFAQNDPITSDIFKPGGGLWAISSRAADDFGLGSYQVDVGTSLVPLTVQSVLNLEVGTINLETDIFSQASSSSETVINRWATCQFLRGGAVLTLRVTGLFAVFRTFQNANGVFETVRCYDPSEPGVKGVLLQRIWMDYDAGAGWAELIRFERLPGGATQQTTVMGQQTRSDLLDMLSIPTVAELLVGSSFVEQTRSSTSFNHFYTYQAENTPITPNESIFKGRYTSVARAQTEALERAPYTYWNFDASSADVTRYGITGDLSSWAMIRRPLLPILGGMSDPDPLFIGALTLPIPTLEVRKSASEVKQILVSDLVPVTDARDVASPAAHYHHPLASALLVTKPEQGGTDYGLGRLYHLAAWHPWRDAPLEVWRALGTRRPPTYAAFIKHAQGGEPVPPGPEHGLAVLDPGLALYSEAPFKPTRPPFFLPEALERFEAESWNALALKGALEQYPEGYHADPKPTLPLSGPTYPGRWFWPDDKKRVKLAPGLYRAVYRLDDWHELSSVRHPYKAALVGRAIRLDDTLPLEAVGGLIEWHGLFVRRAFSVFSLAYQTPSFDFTIGDVMRLEFRVTSPMMLSQLALMPV